MAMLNAGHPGILTPEEVGALVVRPFIDAAGATTVSTVVTASASKDFRIPLVTGDPAAGFVAENAEIPLADATTSELIVTPAKLAGLTRVSRELASDSTPEALTVVGDALVRDMHIKADAAFFGNVAAPAPAGLGGLTGISTVNGAATATAYTDIDLFLDGLAKVANQGHQADHIVAHPDTVLMLAKLREASGSLRPLLEPDPTKPGAKTLSGVPLVPNRAVPAAKGVAYIIPRAVSYAVVRSDVDVRVDESVYFTADALAVRATMRVGFGFPHPAAICRVQWTV